ncbi:hypothetical protein I9W82_004690 [Candida metapsilosis]|uniref:Uncharacterized protein n=1 Tax=Candida metapsilosis TaxID=273372 RepID=A0A8H7Z873_9ASCO|nr:hypothetical protein I9W82_004690 [Candida metapsilosis]
MHLLDHLPFEIWTKIIVYAGIDNLISLLSDEGSKILDEYPQLRTFINKVIENTSIQYNNLIYRPRQFDRVYTRDYLGSTFFNQKDPVLLKTTNDFLTLYDYCSFQNLPVVLSLNYSLECDADIELMREIAKHLKSESVVELHIRFQECTGFFHEYQLNDFFHFKSITGLHLGGKDDPCPIIGIDKLFPGLKNVYLEHYTIDSFHNLKNSKIENLSICGPFTEKSWLDLADLPVSLRFLSVQRCTIVLNDQGSQPLVKPQLEKLSLTDVGIDDPIETVVTFIMEQITESNTKTFRWRSPTFELHDGTCLVVETMLSIETPRLGHLEFEFSAYSPRLNWSGFDNLTKLQLNDIGGSTLYGQFVFPTHLQELEINGSELQNFNIPEDALPLGLQRLCIRDFRGQHLYPPNLGNFMHLKHLTLYGVNGEDAQHFEFPHSLRVLVIEHSLIRSLEGMQFPTHLNSLTLRECKLESIDNILFPDELRSLDVSYNSLQSVSRVKFPKKLHTLNFRANDLTSFCQVDIPTTLRVLAFDYCSLEKVDVTTNIKGEALQLEKLKLEANKVLRSNNIKLAPTLKVLSLRNCGLEEIEGIEFPAALEELDLSENFLRDLSLIPPTDSTGCESSADKSFRMDTNFLSSLAVVDLAHNNFKKIPSCVTSLRSLKSLDFSLNKSKAIECEFKSECLQYVNLRDNADLSEINLLLNQSNHAVDSPTVNFSKRKNSPTVYKQHAENKVMFCTANVMEDTKSTEPWTVYQSPGNSVHTT